MRAREGAAAAGFAVDPAAAARGLRAALAFAAAAAGAGGVTGPLVRVRMTTAGAASARARVPTVETPAATDTAVSPRRARKSPESGLIAHERVAHGGLGKTNHQSVIVREVVVRSPRRAS